MAKLINEGTDGWRVRVGEKEYELSLEELQKWILEYRVQEEHEVRPPITRRWKLARNAAELSSVFANREAIAWEAGRAEREAKAKAAAEVQAVRIAEAQAQAKALAERRAAQAFGRQSRTAIGCLAIIILPAIGLASGKEELFGALCFLGIAIGIGFWMSAVKG